MRRSVYIILWKLLSRISSWKFDFSLRKEKSFSWSENCVYYLMEGFFCMKIVYRIRMVSKFAEYNSIEARS